MAWTSHGHHIENTDHENEPASKARCGGPVLCKICSRESNAYKVNHLFGASTGKVYVPSQIMKWFYFDHLPPELKSISRPIADLASELDARLPDGPEKSVALRKLLEAKDAAIRACI